MLNIFSFEYSNVLQVMEPENTLILVYKCMQILLEFHLVLPPGLVLRWLGTAALISAEDIGNNL